MDFSTTFSRYKKVKKLGEGGTGEVYLVREFETDTEYALKTLRPDGVTTIKRRRFKNEIAFCFRENHEGIVKVLDFGLVSADGIDIPFYVMPLYDCSLRQFIEERTDPERSFEIVRKILDAVEASHLLGVVHRDLKPENILVRNQGTELALADFGIALFADELRETAIKTKDSERLANFRYSAPEQREKGGRADLRSDIFALGLIINELFTSQVPQGSNFASIEAMYPSYSFLDRVVDQMLQQSPDQRPESIREIKLTIEVLSNKEIAKQRLSEQTRVVVKDFELSDPILDDPIRVDHRDWDNGVLKLHLSQRVNQKWLLAFQNMGGHESVMGHGPETFSFHGDVATHAVQGDSAKRVVDYFISWLPRVHQVYANLLEREERERIERERREVKSRIAREEERLRVLNELNL